MNRNKFSINGKFFNMFYYLNQISRKNAGSFNGHAMNFNELAISFNEISMSLIK